MRATWKEHPNLAGGPAAMLLSIHDQFRAAAERLLLLVDREDDLGWVARAFAPLSQTLHHHLDREETLVVPVLLELTPEEAWGEVQRG